MCYNLLRNVVRWDVNAATNEFFNNEWKYPEDPRDLPPVNINNIKKDFKNLSGGKDVI